MSNTKTARDEQSKQTWRSSWLINLPRGVKGAFSKKLNNSCSNKCIDYAKSVQTTETSKLIFSAMQGRNAKEPAQPDKTELLWSFRYQAPPGSYKKKIKNKNNERKNRKMLKENMANSVKPHQHLSSASSELQEQQEEHQVAQRLLHEWS